MLTQPHHTCQHHTIHVLCYLLHFSASDKAQNNICVAIVVNRIWVCLFFALSPNTPLHSHCWHNNNRMDIFLIIPATPQTYYYTSHSPFIFISEWNFRITFLCFKQWHGVVVTTLIEVEWGHATSFLVYFHWITISNGKEARSSQFIPATSALETATRGCHN